MHTNHNVPFSTLTTLKVGGTAKTVHYLDSIEECIEELAQQHEECFVIGDGSNILAPDDVYTGAVYIPRFENITVEESADTVFVTAEAGASWDALAQFAVEHNWWGIENLSGIPGTVGGAVVQNIGAYGAVLSHTLTSVTAYDTHLKKTFTILNDACMFGYRTSMFKRQLPRYVILSATFSLTKKPTPQLSYKDLVSHFDININPALSEVREAVLAIRKKKFPSLEEYGTAGSFFLNPVVSQEVATDFQGKYPDMPTFALPEGGVKVPLAWILDHVVNAKGMRVGGAFVWPEQALVIATEAGATSNDVRALQKHIVKKVFEKTNITIIPEVCII